MSVHTHMRTMKQISLAVDLKLFFTTSTLPYSKPPRIHQLILSSIFYLRTHTHTDTHSHTHAHTHIHSYVAMHYENVCSYVQYVSYSYCRLPVIPMQCGTHRHTDRVTGQLLFISSDLASTDSCCMSCLSSRLPQPTST